MRTRARLGLGLSGAPRYHRARHRAARPRTSPATRETVASGAHQPRSAALRGRCLRYAAERLPRLCGLAGYCGRSLLLRARHVEHRFKRAVDSQRQPRQRSPASATCRRQTVYQRINAVRDSNLALQRADREYVSRAISNNAHFLLARPSVSIDPEAYARLALGTTAELNALGTYDWFHQRALELASRIAHSEVSAESRADAVRDALAAEAFALHFLEDSFAAGHVAGNW